METVLFHAADQDPATTASLGILNYSRRLVQEFARLPDPGFRLLLLVARGNQDLFVPARMPDWMSADILPGPARGTGLGRIWCDQVEVLRAIRRHRAALAHFPKGWVSFRKPRGTKFLATLHDAIPEYYAVYHKAHTRPAKRAYFAWAIRHSLRAADRILTDSEASRAHLASLVPGVSGKIESRWIGPGIPVQPGTGTRDSLLVLGSRQPHKATRETLMLLADWNARATTPVPVRVTGLPGWPDAWGPGPDLPGLTWLGRVSDGQLAQEYARARALILLSEIEGFGLPALEAVLAGAAVCYRDVSSVGELMQGAAGAWDGASADGFCRALDAALSAPPGPGTTLREKLAEECRWDRVALRTLNVYRELLG